MTQTRKTRTQKKRKWIQRAVKHPGRVRRDQMRLYGKKAFNSDGDLNRQYLEKGKKHFEETGNRSAVDAYDLAQRLSSGGFKVKDVYYGGDK